jgi:uroporphyrinogen decarboxylase
VDGQERIRRLIAHQPADRVGIFDSFWRETERDFRLQGMPEGVTAEDYFDLDAGMFWFDQSFLLPRLVLEELEDCRIVSDGWGARQREFRDRESTPGLIDFAVKDRESWDALKPHLAYASSRIDWTSLEARYREVRERGRYVMLSVLDPFEATWHKVGPEQQLMLLVLDPDWLRDMYEADTDLLEAAWADLWDRGLQPDALWIFGDIAYRSGLLFSPEHYRQLLMPFHRRLCDLAHRHGCQVIYHSDGDVTQALPLLVECGIDCLHPLEVKAGMDVVALKREWGSRLAFMGNIDARLFQANDRAGLEDEIRAKIPLAMARGGYVYHTDHSVPPGTQLDTYRFALKLVRRYGRYGP